MDYYSDAEIYKKVYEEALKHNEETINEMRSYQKELEDVSLNLKENQKHLFQNIMVPLGSKALIRGKLMHTNEVFVNLGDKWFVKTSAARAREICGRMMKKCEQTLNEFEKESSLLTSNLEVPQDLELFPSGDVKDIIEPYDEESEKRWKEKHRENVKKYKNREATNKISDTELFARLEELEEKELGDVKKEKDDDNGNEDELLLNGTEASDELYTQEQKNNRFMEKEISETEFEKLDLTRAKIKKQVSFSDVDISQPSDDSADTIMIRFKHSDNEPTYSSSNNDGINSPADIYRRFLEQVDMKSILKNKHDTFYIRNDDYDYSTPHYNNEEPAREKSTIILGDIVEKSPVIAEKLTESTRPISRFKKSRVQNKA